MENATCQRDILSLAYFLFFFIFDSYSQALQTLLSSTMVTNPQERPRISWVLDQVQNLRDSNGTDVDTNRVWRFQWDFMSGFQWTLDILDYARSLFWTKTTHWTHKPCKHLLSLTSVNSAHHNYTFKHDHTSLRNNVSYFTPKSILSN